MSQTLSHRELHGLQIAAMARLVRRGEVWLVPSESGGAPHEVDPLGPRCSCPDHELHGGKCKHIFAVEYAARRESEPAGAAPFTPDMSTQRAPRKTYRQNWPAYNAAQTHEKEQFQVLLRELGSGLN